MKVKVINTEIVPPGVYTGRLVAVKNGQAHVVIDGDDGTKYFPIKNVSRLTDETVR